jgi:protein sidekick
MMWISVPEAPPVNVRAEPLNSTAVQVWWKPPDPQKINGINQGYKIQAWKGESHTEVSLMFCT